MSATVLSPPVVLTVYAWQPDAGDAGAWAMVYQGPSDMNEADGSGSAKVAAVLEDEPAGLGTWAWWWEADMLGNQGPSYYGAPTTVAGKQPPEGIAA